MPATAGLLMLHDGSATPLLRRSRLSYVVPTPWRPGAWLTGQTVSAAGTADCAPLGRRTQRLRAERPRPETPAARGPSAALDSGMAVRRPGTLLTVCACAVVLGIAVVHAGAVVALLLPAMISVFVLILLNRSLIGWPDEAARRRVLWWTMVSFGAHLAFGLVATLVSSDLRFYLAADSFTYDRLATELVDHWRNDAVMPFIPSGKEGFYYLLGGLYWMFGAHAAAGLAVNALLSAALVPVLSDTTHRLFGSAAARFACPLVVLLPGMFLWTSQLLKEAAILLLLAVALSCAVRLVSRMSMAPLILLTVSLALALTFRSWVALVVAAGLLIALALSSRHLLSGLGNGLSSLIVVSGVVLGSGVGYSGYQAAIDSDLKKASVIRLDLAYSAGTSFDADADVSTTGAALAYLPKGIVSFLFGPTPWSIRGVRQLPFVPEMLAWWLLLPSLWAGFRAARRLIGRRVLLMVLPALGTTVMMSLALGNFGTVVRERLQVQVLLVPLIALGLAHRAARKAPAEETPVAAPPVRPPAPLELLPQG